MVRALVCLLISACVWVSADSFIEEPSKHLKNAVEDALWGTAEIAIGVVETLRGDPLGGVLLGADGLRNWKNAWEEFQEAVAEKNEKQQSNE